MRILKAFATAQFASIVDFLLTVLLSSFLGVYYVVATALGALAGGIANCVLNYRWVFPATDNKKKYVAIKYFIVWVLSIVFNTYGTYAMTELVRNSSWVIKLLGIYHDQIYIASKLIVAVLVAVSWNYQMQRFFVYKNLHIRTPHPLIGEDNIQGANNN